MQITDRSSAYQCCPLANVAKLTQVKCSTHAVPYCVRHVVNSRVILASDNYKVSGLTEYHQLSTQCRYIIADQYAEIRIAILQSIYFRMPVCQIHMA